MKKKSNRLTIKKACLLFTAAALIMSFPAWAETSDTADTRESTELTSFELASLQLDPQDTLAVSTFSLSLENSNSISDITPMTGNRASVTTTLKAYPKFTNPMKTTASGDYLFAASMITTSLLNVADYMTTTKALKYPVLQEGNPLMKPFVGKPMAFAAVKAGLTTVSFFMLKKLYKKNKTAAWALSTVTNIALSFVVANNLRLIDACENGRLSGF